MFKNTESPKLRTKEEHKIQAANEALNHIQHGNLGTTENLGKELDDVRGKLANMAAHEQDPGTLQGIQPRILADHAPTEVPQEDIAPLFRLQPRR